MVVPTGTVGILRLLDAAPNPEFEKVMYGYVIQAL
jgi:hypothetical protein